MRKKQIRQLLVLSSVTAVLAIVLALMPVLFPTEKMQFIDLDPIEVYTVDANTVTALTWTYEGGTYRLYKTPDGWVSPDAQGIAIDQKAVSAMLENITTIKAEKTLEAASGENYGLDSPVSVVSITTADGQDQITFGSTNGMGTHRYVTNGDGQIYLVRASVLIPFRNRLSGVVEREAVPNLGNADTVTITNASGTITMTYVMTDETTGSWYNGEEKLNDTAVVKLLRPVSSIRWMDCVAYDAQEADLAKYGLDAPVSVLTSQEGETTITVEFGASAGDKRVYARISGSSYIYTVATDVSDPLESATLISLQP